MSFTFDHIFFSAYFFLNADNKFMAVPDPACDSSE